MVYFVKVMFSAEVRELLVQVISSWQVITVTIVLVIYIFLVNYVAKLNRPESSRKLFLPKAKKPAKPAKPVAPSESDDLDLEDETLEKE